MTNLGKGRRFRILNVTEDYSRECIRQIVGTSISGERAAQYLSQLMQCRSKPSNIVCDNGTEFSSKAMLHWSRNQQVNLEFIQPARPTQKTFVESFNGKFRDSCLNQHCFHSLDEASRVIEIGRKIIMKSEHTVRWVINHPVFLRIKQQENSLSM